MTIVVANLSVVEINRRNFLGHLNKNEDGSVTITDHVEGGLSNSLLKTYVKNDNVGKLKEITFEGTGINYTSRPLDDDETDQFKVYIAKMKEIKEDAMALLENQYFDGSW